MATGTNHWKLGLFVIAGVAFCVISLIVLGARSWSQVGVPYVSYFDESVQGLELGSPVKFRGVTVGHVGSIEVAPDQRHIQVTSDLDVRQLNRMELGASAADEPKARPLLAAHPNLRAQLAQAGITGGKYVSLDYVESDEAPPALPFPVPERNIPTTPSLMRSLENSVAKSFDRVPELAENAARVLATLNAILSRVDRAQLPEHALSTLEEANQALATLQGTLHSLDAASLSKEVQASLSALNGSLTRANQLMDRLEAKHGLFDTAQRSLGALGEVARGGQSLGGDLEATLHDVRGAARSIQRFVDALERDPDMLLKGRAPGVDR
jgi:phospholipid/cholesterol/gamma-HCH transport system substrate-binding protein